MHLVVDLGELGEGDGLVEALDLAGGGEGDGLVGVLAVADVRADDTLGVEDGEEDGDW